MKSTSNFPINSRSNLFQGSNDAFPIFIIVVFIHMFQWFYNSVKDFINGDEKKLTLRNTNLQKQIESPKHKSSTGLFPTLSLFKNLTSKDLDPCSTNFNSELISFTNSKGELEFRLIDKSKQALATEIKKESGIQQLSPASEGYSPPTGKQLPIKNDQHLMETNDLLALSPVSSVKSNSSLGGIDTSSAASSVSPLPEHEQHEQHEQHEHEHDHESLNDDKDEGEISDGSECGSGESKVHQCPHCDSKFRMRGYLTRHIKKHSKQKAYKCPFYDPSATQKCHATGGFSRRDTYKTHLKARHFKYPPGVKSGDRIGMMGWCGICGEKFSNNEIWVERHIELGLCPGLPEEYIKTLKIGKKKTGKHSKLLDVDNSQINSNISNMFSPLKQQSPLSTMGTPSPQSYGTPTPNFSFQQTSNPQTSQNFQNQVLQQQLNNNVTALLYNWLEKSQFNSASAQSPATAAMAQNLFNQLTNTNQQQQQQQKQQTPITQSLTPTSSMTPNSQLEQQLLQLNRSSSSLGSSVISINNKAQQTQQQQQQQQQQEQQSQTEEEDFPSLDGECSPEVFMSYPGLIQHEQEKQVQEDQEELLQKQADQIQHQIQYQQEQEKQQQQMIFNRAYLAALQSLQPQYQSALNANMMNMLNSHQSQQQQQQQFATPNFNPMNMTGMNSISNFNLNYDL